MKDIQVTKSKNLKNTYIPITVLIGIIGILIVSIYNNAFKNGYFTCKKYILNTYLYILLVIVIVTLEVLLFDYNNLSVEKMYSSVYGSKNIGWPIIILNFIIIIGLLIATMTINPRNVILKHFVWIVFALSIGTLVYPSYLISKKENTLISVILSLIGILVFFSALAFIKPEWISLSWGPVLLFLLIGVIIVLLVNLIVNKGKKRVPKAVSFFIIGLFILFVLYDTKLIQIHAKYCKEKTVDYINESLGVFLDSLNLFNNLVNVSY